MQKTKLGVTVGLLGAAMYFVGLFGVYLVTMLLAAYILMFEENDWLKQSAVKAVVLMIGFSLLSVVIYLIPDLMEFINSIVRIFGGHFYLNFLSNLANAIGTALNIIEKILFIGLGIKAFNQGDIKIPAVDKLIEKYM